MTTWTRYAAGGGVVAVVEGVVIREVVSDVAGEVVRGGAVVAGGVVDGGVVVAGGVVGGVVGGGAVTGGGVVIFGVVTGEKALRRSGAVER